MTTPRIERRLAAILAADVAGFSQLMEIDEVGTLTALKAHRRDRVDPAITGHNGRIVKTTGDGMLAEFASVVDAVTCAVAIQRAVLAFNGPIAPERRIVLRIGINVGDIIFDGGDIFGDGVNVAARLEALCEPGGLCVSRSANEQVRDRLSLPFVDLGEQSVKNMARTIGVFGLSAAAIAGLPEGELTAVEPEVAAPPRGGARRSGVAGVVASVLVVVALVVAGGVWLRSRGAPLLPASVATAPAARPEPYSRQDRRMSLIVLPFENTSGEAGQETVAARITRDVTERFARSPGVPLVSAATAAGYRGKTIDMPTIGRDHDVHFALAGSARRQDGRLLVTATLYQTADDQSVWSQRYDRADDPDGWTGMVASIFNDTLNAEIDAEAAQAKRDHPDSLDARDYFIASLTSALQQTTRDNFQARIALLDKSLAADPTYWQALANAAYLRAINVINGWSADREADLAFAAKTVDQLIVTRPREVFVLNLKAYVLRAQGNLDEALSVRHHIAEIDPSIPENFREMGVILFDQGRWKEALTNFLMAKRLVPPSENFFILDRQTAQALLANGRFADAIPLARIAIAESPPDGAGDAAWLALIAAESGVGQVEQARADVQRYLATQPTWPTIAAILKVPRFGATPNLLDGLRRAGMPEQ